MADQLGKMNKLLDPSNVMREGEMSSNVIREGEMPSDNVVREGEIGSRSVIREGEMFLSPDGYYRMKGGPNFTEDELAMINSAQQGLMQMDPEGMKDAITGLEITKEKIKRGGQLTEQESSGIMSIIQSLGGALKDIFVPSQEERIRLMEQRRINLGE
jgi:hypothetical protein